jgi:hypothetical protein
MHSFVCSALPGQVLFGFGSIDKVADEIRHLGCRRALVVSTPQQAPQEEDLAARLGDLSIGPLPKLPCTVAPLAPHPNPRPLQRERYSRACSTTPFIASRHDITRKLSRSARMCDFDGNNSTSASTMAVKHIDLDYFEQLVQSRFRSRTPQAGRLITECLNLPPHAVGQ